MGGLLLYWLTHLAGKIELVVIRMLSSMDAETPHDLTTGFPQSEQPRRLGQCGKAFDGFTSEVAWNHIGLILIIRGKSLILAHNQAERIKLQLLKEGGKKIKNIY